MCFPPEPAGEEWEGLYVILISVKTVIHCPTAARWGLGLWGCVGESRSLGLCETNQLVSSGLPWLWLREPVLLCRLATRANSYKALEAILLVLSVLLTVLQPPSPCTNPCTERLICMHKHWFANCCLMLYVHYQTGLAQTQFVHKASCCTSITVFTNI